MQVRILDLDGSTTAQAPLLARSRPVTFAAAAWGPRIRLACSAARFRTFERALALLFGSETDAGPVFTFCGSGDFHHVTLALLRRQTQPFNLLVLDNHPDWMRGVPFLHCGTWLYHAARLPLVRQIYHVGGDVDFDNYYRWMAPWGLLRSGKITIIPARRRYERGPWKGIAHHCLKPTAERIRDLLGPYRAELARFPLYASVDKDVLGADEAVVNWDSGHVTLDDLRLVLDAFLDATPAGLAGMDTVGDWSPVRLRGLFRRVIHWTEHPSLSIRAEDAAKRNTAVNLALLQTITSRALRTSA
jgi:hypothetical protein